VTGATLEFAVFAAEVVAIGAFFVRERHIGGLEDGEIVRLRDPIDDEMVLITVEEPK
jgi:hypothetical protein